VTAPALAGCRAVAALRAGAHLSLVAFLRAVVDVPLVAPPSAAAAAAGAGAGAPAPADARPAWQRCLPAEEAARVVLGALTLATPDADAPAVVGAGAAWPSLPALLDAGFVQPLALAWVRPDFAAARAGYAALVAALSPALAAPFPWAALGLSPYAHAVGGGAAGGGGGAGGDFAATPLPAGSPPLSSGAGLSAGFDGGMHAYVTPITPGMTPMQPESGGGGGGGGDA